MQYCFLNTVYTDENDESIFYEVVLSNKSYTEISLKRVNLQELTEFAESDEYITDFSVKDCYLKCAPVGRYVIDEKIKESIAKKEDVRDYSFKSSVTSLFAFLRYGAGNSFYVIADELALSGTETLTVLDGITPFTKIACSQSSLSVYAREVFNKELRNHYLIQEIDGVLKFMPFYFLVPANHQLEMEAQYISTKKINNVEYKIFRAENLGVAEPVSIISQALLNKAACMHVVYDSMLRAVAALQKQYYTGAGNLTWVDNGTHQHNIKPISFEPSYKKLSSSVIGAFIESAKDIKKKYKTLEEAQQFVRSLKLDKVSAVTLNCLVNILMSSDSVTDIVTNCISVTNIYSGQLFYNDLYLHRMKIFTSVTQVQIVSLLSPVLYGSNETGVTTVRG